MFISEFADLVYRQDSVSCYQILTECLRGQAIIV